MDFPLSKCKMIIATHADADHVQALHKVKDRLKGVKTAELTRIEPELIERESTVRLASAKKRS